MSPEQRASKLLDDGLGYLLGGPLGSTPWGERLASEIRAAVAEERAAIAQHLTELAVGLDNEAHTALIDAAATVNARWKTQEGE